VHDCLQSTRLSVTVFGRRNARKSMANERSADVQPVGWVNTLLMDHRGVLATDVGRHILWPRERANPIGAAFFFSRTHARI
jgi:hypothetical protein